MKHLKTFLIVAPYIGLVYSMYSYGRLMGEAAQLAQILQIVLSKVSICTGV